MILPEKFVSQAVYLLRVNYALVADQLIVYPNSLAVIQKLLLPASAVASGHNLHIGWQVLLMGSVFPQAWTGRVEQIIH